MASPHMRRRYRAVGARPGLIYLIVLVGLATFYLGQRVYCDQRAAAVDALQREFDSYASARDRLLAQRDSLLGLPVIGPRAEALGLSVAHLDQLARLPLWIPLPDATFQAPPASFELADAAGRLWDWLDGPTIKSQEALAGE